MLGLLSDTERALVGKVGSCEEKDVKCVTHGGFRMLAQVGEAAAKTVRGAIGEPETGFAQSLSGAES